MAGARSAGSTLGSPSDRTAVVVRARLPAGLERLRRQSVADAGDGLPAHLTMLYPFVAPGRLDGRVRRMLVRVAAATPPFDYRLVRAAWWPDTVYAAIEPVEPFVRLQATLQTTFPDFPVYGRPTDFGFVPHVTIAEGAAAANPATTDDPAWRALPWTARAAAIEVIAAAPGERWRTVWRIGFGRPAPPGAPGQGGGAGPRGAARMPP